MFYKEILRFEISEKIHLILKTCSPENMDFLYIEDFSDPNMF